MLLSRQHGGPGFLKMLLSRQHGGPSSIKMLLTAACGSPLPKDAAEPSARGAWLSENAAAAAKALGKILSRSRSVIRDAWEQKCLVKINENKCGGTGDQFLSLEMGGGRSVPLTRGGRPVCFSDSLEGSGRSVPVTH